MSILGWLGLAGTPAACPRCMSLDLVLVSPLWSVRIDGDRVYRSRSGYAAGCPACGAPLRITGHGVHLLREYTGGPAAPEKPLTIVPKGDREKGSYDRIADPDMEWPE